MFSLFLRASMDKWEVWPRAPRRVCSMSTFSSCWLERDKWVCVVARTNQDCEEIVGAVETIGTCVRGSHRSGFWDGCLSDGVETLTFVYSKRRQ
jgi:hypothetical protein